VVATILQKAGTNNRIRGYASNVSNYNPYKTDNPPAYTEGSPSPDESRYADNLAAAFGERGLPTKFIIDQGRVGLDGAREEWGEWCNIFPAGFGQPFTSNTGNANVDAIVWIKPGGESDGECGMAGAPRAGAWFDEFAQMLAKNAHPDIRADGGDGGGSNPGGNCVSKWSQCGGQGWTGPTCCVESTCKVSNPWYSQCL
jgi:cellulose 1,4-beta-cellobiosidase